MEGTHGDNGQDPNDGRGQRRGWGNIVEVSKAEEREEGRWCCPHRASYHECDAVEREPWWGAG